VLRFNAFSGAGFCFYSRYNSEENGKDKQKTEKEGSDQIYSKSGKGFRMYLTDIQDEKPDLYNALNPMVKDLEDRETASMAVSIGGGIGGIALIGFGFYTMANGASKMTSEKMSSGAPSTSSTGLIAFGGGAALVFGSFILGNFIIHPKPDDYNRFINKHNRLNPDNPLRMEKLKIEVGFNFKHDGGGVCLAYLF
jgi:hypothetical protein